MSETRHATRGRSRIPGLINSVNSLASLEFFPFTKTYASDGYNGIFNWLGTDGETVAYGNPDGSYYTASQVSNQDGTRIATMATNHSITPNNETHTAQVAGAWWKADFGIYDVTPTRVMIAGRSADGHHPRWWSVHGSTNNSDWDTLYTATAVGPNDGTTFSATIAGASAYRYLRIYQNDVNSNGGLFLVMGDLEFWGTMEIR